MARSAGGDTRLQRYAGADMGGQAGIGGGKEGYGEGGAYSPAAAISGQIPGIGRLPGRLRAGELLAAVEPRVGITADAVIDVAGVGLRRLVITAGDVPCNRYEVVETLLVGDPSQRIFRVGAVPSPGGREELGHHPSRGGPGRRRQERREDYRDYDFPHKPSPH